MKIFQLNTWGGRLGSQIINLIKSENPDIVCFQEAIRVEGGNGFVFNDLDEIVEGTNFSQCFFSPCFSWNLMNRTAQSGLAILSNFKFSHKKNVFTRKEHVNKFDIIDTDYNVRSLQHVSIEHDGKSVHILNHHGHHIPGHKNGDDETFRQCSIIANYLENLSGQIVMCGDFNLKPDAPSLGLLNAKLVNHAKELKVPTTRTYLSEKTEVCDYIFTSSDLKIQNFRVLDEVVSDHKALTVEF